MSKLCWSLLPACGKCLRDNCQFDVANRRKGIALPPPPPLSCPSPLPRLFKATARYSRTLAKRHLIRLCSRLQGCQDRQGDLLPRWYQRSLAAFTMGTLLALVGIEGYTFRNQFGICVHCLSLCAQKCCH